MRNVITYQNSFSVKRSIFYDYAYRIWADSGLVGNQPECTIAHIPGVSIQTVEFFCQLHCRVIGCQRKFDVHIKY